MTSNLDWENVDIIGLNKEKGHVETIPFLDRKVALKKEKSPFHQSLNGKWKFNWVERPADRPREFYKEDYDVKNWDDIQVPGTFELQGYGMPYYLANSYPPPLRKKNAPNINHNENPVGSYKTEFTVADDWDNREIFIHFGGDI